MALDNNKMEFVSPSEDTIPWATPNNEINKLEHPSKRKCNSDSGYMSFNATPASSRRNMSSNCMVMMTPDIYKRFSSLTEGNNIYTPAMKPKTDCIKKKRLLQCSQEETTSCLNTPTATEMDSFSDFSIDTSLYNEPMEISMIELSPQFNVKDDNLGLCEISKKIAFDFPVETNSCYSDPTPRTGRLFCHDRLFKTSAFLRPPLTSPRNASFPLKNKIIKSRSLNGIEKVDILGQLKNFSIAVRNILSYLPDSDLSTVTMVSKTWKNICLSCPKSKERWTKYTADRKERKENLGWSVGKQKRTTTPLVNRNYSTPFKMRQPSSPPVSPTKFRFHLFQKEARRLKENEKLTDCPRCSLPSTVNSVSRLARCTRAGCGFEFCCSCRSPYHGPRPCNTSTPASPQKPKKIGSKESRRFLRRL